MKLTSGCTSQSSVSTDKRSKNLSKTEIPSVHAGETPISRPRNQAVQKLDEIARDRAWALYQYTRLLLAYGDQYRSDCERIIREIQAIQDQATALEKSLAEEEEVPRDPEVEEDLTAHMGPA